MSISTLNKDVFFIIIIFLTSSFSRNAALSSGLILAVFSRKSLIAEFASEKSERIN